MTIQLGALVLATLFWGLESMAMKLCTLKLGCGMILAGDDL